MLSTTDTDKIIEVVLSNSVNHFDNGKIKEIENKVKIQEHGKLILNMTDCDSANSHAMGVVIALKKIAARAGEKLYLVVKEKAILDYIDLLQLKDAVLIYSDISAARLDCRG